MWDSHNKVTYLWLLSIKAILSLLSPQPCWRYNGNALRGFFSSCSVATSAQKRSKSELARHVFKQDALKIASTFM